MSKSYDLSTNSKWANLAAGSHTVTLKAKGSGYADSAFSNEVTVTKAAETKTLEAGTYKWVDTIILDQGIEYTADINFVSNDEPYVKLVFSHAGEYVYTVGLYYESDGTEWDPYTDQYNTYWEGHEEYQTITLSTPQTVSAEFYNWAITGGNLVKQTGETWVLNNIVYAGIETMNIDFVSNNTQYTSISYGEEHVSSPYGLAYNTTCVFYHEDRIWVNEAYRTITFLQPVTNATLLEWLQANGTKQ